MKIFSQGITHHFLLLQKFVIWTLVFPLCDLPHHKMQFSTGWLSAFRNTEPGWRAKQLFTSALFYQVLITFFHLVKVNFHVNCLSDLKRKLGFFLYPPIRVYVQSRNRKKKKWCGRIIPTTKQRWAMITTDSVHHYNYVLKWKFALFYITNRKLMLKFVSWFFFVGTAPSALAVCPV